MNKPHSLFRRTSLAIDETVQSKIVQIAQEAEKQQKSPGKITRIMQNMDVKLSKIMSEVDPRSTLGSTSTPTKKRRVQRESTEAGKPWPCPACDKNFKTGNTMQFHYEEEHAVCDPTKVTVRLFTCKACKQS